MTSYSQFFDGLSGDARQAVGGATVPGNDAVWIDLDQWCQHEGAFVHARVGQGQAGLTDDGGAVQQQVKVQCARGIGETAFAAEALLQGEERIEEGLRGKGAVERGHGVDEIGLVGMADRGGAPQ